MIRGIWKTYVFTWSEHTSSRSLLTPISSLQSLNLGVTCVVSTLLQPLALILSNPNRRVSKSFSWLAMLAALI